MKTDWIAPLGGFFLRRDTLRNHVQKIVFDRLIKLIAWGEIVSNAKLHEHVKKEDLVKGRELVKMKRKRYGTINWNKLH